MLTKRTLILSLVFILTLVTLFAPSTATDGQALQPHRRMLKKRATSPAASQPDTQQKDTGSEDPAGGPAIGVASDPHAGEASNSTTITSTGTSTGTGSSTTSSSSTTTTSTNSTSTTSTSSSTTSSTSTNSTTSTSTSSTSSTTSALPATPPPADNTPSGIATPPPAAIVTNTAGPVTVTYTSSNSDSTATSVPKTSTSGSLSKASLSVIIVIASCIGGAIIIWTIIRKWKFGKSADFEGRMNPIDWQPSSSDRAFDDDISGHRRRGSGSSHGSFHSGSEHAGAGYGATSNQGHGSEFAHDFTAGPSHLAPVGGYADLSRGSSPQPMSEALNRGPSLTRGYNVGGQYGSYDTHGPRY